MSLNKGDAYGIDPENPTGDFNRVQAPIRKRRINEYFAASKLTSAEIAAVIAKMRDSDLKPLGIDM